MLFVCVCTCELRTFSRILAFRSRRVHANVVDTDRQNNRHPLQICMQMIVPLQLYRRTVFTVSLVVLDVGGKVGVWPC